MEPERWRQIERLFESALESPESDHAAFLERACAGDDELRREVASLLAQRSAAGQFIEAPAMKMSRDIGRKSGRCARRVRAGEHQRHGASIVGGARRQLGAGRRNGHGAVYPLPARSDGWSLAGTAGGPAGCPVHLCRLVARRKMDVPQLLGRWNVPHLAATFPGWPAGTDHLWID